MNKYKSIFIKRRIVSIFLTVLMLVGCIAPLESRVFAEGEGNTTSTDPAPIATNETTVPAPKKVKAKAGFQRVYLSWTKVSCNAGDDGKVYYEIRDGKGKKSTVVYMQKKKNSDKLIKAKDLKKTEAWIPFDPYPGKKNGEAKNGKKKSSAEARTATFAVRAYIKKDGKKVYSDYTVKEDIELVHPMYVIVKAKGNVPILKASDSNKKVATAKKGHYYIVFGGSRIKGENKRVIIKIWNKKDHCWDARYIRSRNVEIVRYVYKAQTGSRTKNPAKGYYFTEKQVEDFINDKKPVSKNNNFIWVNTYNQRVYLFKKKSGRWEITRNPKGVLCNTGRELSPYGSYKITGFMARKKTTGTKWWCLFNHVGIHEKLPDALGKPASGGCVRIPDSEAKWFYDNIRGGTGIFVY